MSSEYTRPYVKAQKNGDRDAKGIAEAATRPTMRFVSNRRARISSTCKPCIDPETGWSASGLL
jgi:hypothetical protein